MIKQIIMLLILILLISISNITYSKGAHVSARISSHVSSHVSGAKSSSGKTYTGSSAAKSYSTNAKGFSSDGTTSTTLVPRYMPYPFFMHGNNYNINGEDKKVDYTLSNIAIKTVEESK